uniref:Uncharacterized protein n=1 Tax=Anopheles merus TaxID=30066 RepID=A0A182VPG0_ANOME
MAGCYSGAGTGGASGWTGVPLISTASSNRRQRKHFTGSGGTVNNGNHYPYQQHLAQQQQQQHYNLPKGTSAGVEFDENANLTRLALHAQGAPLILSTNRYHHSHHRNHKSSSSASQQTAGCGVGSAKAFTSGGSQSLLESSTNCLTRSSTQLLHPGLGSTGGQRRPLDAHLVPVGAAGQSSGGVIKSYESVVSLESIPSSGNTSSPPTVMSGSAMASSVSSASSSSFSTSSTTSSSSTEMCLPRIIKPRKRRKKDRKPSAQPSSGSNGGAGSAGNGTEGGISLPLSEPISPSASSNCSCRLCDPFGRIWAFPMLRQASCSSADGFEPEERRKNVGVIGSNRNSGAAVRGKWCTSTESAPFATITIGDSADECLSRKGSFSDSGSDSGCDLLLNRLPGLCSTEEEEDEDEENDDQGGSASEVGKGDSFLVTVQSKDPFAGHYGNLSWLSSIAGQPVGSSTASPCLRKTNDDELLLMTCFRRTSKAPRPPPSKAGAALVKLAAETSCSAGNISNRSILRRSCYHQNRKIMLSVIDSLQMVVLFCDLPEAVADEHDHQQDSLWECEGF